jgi:DNA-binding LytR/AlgR family response regulator
MSVRQYQCIVVDDEPIARKIVRTYIEQIPNLMCVGEFKNAFEALTCINETEKSVEIVFLDINMPNLSGVAMAKILAQKQQVIFTTAYSEYAVESYDLNAADYLLKPFLFDRFAQAVFKAIERLKASVQEPSILEHEPEPSIFLKSGVENYPIMLREILYCEAMKNYTKVVMVNGKTYHPLLSISKLETELMALSDMFTRVHRSFLISKKYLNAIGANHLMIGSHKIPLGEQYKSHFLAQIGVK